MSANQGVRAALTTYKRGYLAPADPTLSPVFAGDWDQFDARLFRYLHYDLYYFNNVYTTLEKYANQHKSSEGLYKYTRGIYNPVFRLVNITAAKCYGGSLDWDDLTSGAVPMKGLNTRTEAALRQVWKWSNFGQMKMRYARFAARYGDVPIKIVDDPVKARVRLEVLHPGVIREAEVNPVGHVQSVVIEYERLDPLDATPGATCLYREVINKERFATYRVKNEQVELYAWQTDVNGNPVSEWENPYGFVPLALAHAADIGRQWGAVTFHGGTLSKIDHLNDLASLTVDHIRQSVDAMWYIAGPSSIDELDQGDAAAATGDEDDETERERSTIPVLTGPEGSHPYPMVANVDFGGALQKIQAILDEIEHDCPELAFAKLRDFQQHSAPAVRTVLGDAIDRLSEFNGSLDSTLLRAFQMAITVGGVGGYRNFESIRLEDYEQGALDFEIKPREIVLDDLTKLETLTLFKNTEAPPRWIWSELGKTEGEIAEGEDYLETQSRAVAGEVARTLMASQGSKNNTVKAKKKSKGE